MNKKVFKNGLRPTVISIAQNEIYVNPDVKSRGPDLSYIKYIERREGYFNPQQLG